MTRLRHALNIYYNTAFRLMKPSRISIQTAKSRLEKKRARFRISYSLRRNLFLNMFVTVFVRIKRLNRRRENRLIVTKSATKTNGSIRPKYRPAVYVRSPTRSRYLRNSTPPVLMMAALATAENAASKSTTPVRMSSAFVRVRRE